MNQKEFQDQLNKLVNEAIDSGEVTWSSIIQELDMYKSILNIELVIETNPTIHKLIRKIALEE